MKKKLLSSLLCAALVLSMMTGCGASGTTGDSKDKSNTESTDAGDADNESSAAGERDEDAVMTRAESADISALIPIGQQSADAQEMVLPIFDMLYRVSGDGTRYFLAESYEMSDDNKELTIKLKDGLTYHDGEPINADEVVWNFNMRKEQELDTYYTSLGDQKVDIEKVDDLTVKLTLPEASASYSALVGMMQLIPSHLYKDAEDVLNCEANEKGIGTGPYKVKEWNKGESLVLERNEDYYGDKPGMKTLVFKVIPEAANQAVSFESGELDVLKITNAADYEKYAAMDGVEIFTFQEGRNHYLAFNELSDIMKDDKAREAVCMALNQDEMVSGAYGSDAVAENAQNVLIPTGLYYTDEVTSYEQDLDMAKFLIEETGLDQKTLKIIYNMDRANFEDIALIVQQQLKEVGIESEIQGYDSNSYFDQLFEYDGKNTGYDIAVNGYPGTGDPDENRSMFSSASENMVSSDKLDKLWDDESKETDPEKRQEIYKQIAQEVKDIHAMYMVGSTNIILAAKEGYKGLDEVPLIPLFVDYSKIYFESK